MVELCRIIGVDEQVEFVEPTLADVQAEFASWEAWRDTSGRYYARRAGQPFGSEVLVDGEDPLDLRDSIIRWLGLNDEEGASLGQ
jgi:hypothetical protein